VDVLPRAAAQIVDGAQARPRRDGDTQDLDPQRDAKGLLAGFDRDLRTVLAGLGVGRHLDSHPHGLCAARLERERAVRDERVGPLARPAVGARGALGAEPEVGRQARRVVTAREVDGHEADALDPRRRQATAAARWRRRRYANAVDGGIAPQD